MLMHVSCHSALVCMYRVYWFCRHHYVSRLTYLNAVAADVTRYFLRIIILVRACIY